MTSRLEKREAVLAKLAKIPKTVRPAMRQAIEQGAGEVVAFQKRQVAVNTGRLRNSIKYIMGSFKIGARSLAIGGKAGTNVRGDPDLTATIVAGGEGAFYARWVEFGTLEHGLAKGARRKGNVKQDEGRTMPTIAPRPFFYGPWRASRKRIKSRVTRAASKAVKQATQGG